MTSIGMKQSLGSTPRGVAAVCLRMLSVATTPPQTSSFAIPPAVERWLSYPVLDNPLGTWLMALLVLALVYFGFRIARDILVKRLRKFRSRLTDRFNHLPDNVLADIRGWCIFAVALYAASRVPVLPSPANSTARLILIVAVSVQVLITSRIVVDFVIGMVLNRAKRDDGRPDPSIASATQIIRFMTMILLVAIIVLLALSNLGVEITPLITGLGIGGIAVALAAQSILGDLFGSLTILFDKPFLVGEFIIVGDKMGTIESIGVKTTRIRALSGELLIMANSDLLGSRIQNFARQRERRVVFTVGVIYETPLETLQRIPAMLREIVKAQDKVRLDRAHFKSFGSYSLDFEIVYFVLSPDYNLYMDIQQAINFEIARRFAADKIEFAYPTSVDIQRYNPSQPLPLVVHRKTDSGYAPADERPGRPETPANAPARS
jgi:small-conductance mechanosensitive channel